MRGQLARVAQQQEADRRMLDAMARGMERQNADLRLDRMLADADAVIRSGVPLAMRIRRPDGRITIR